MAETMRSLMREFKRLGFDAQDVEVLLPGVDIYHGSGRELEVMRECIYQLYSLDPRDRWFLLMYNRGLTLDEIGARFGLSRAGVSLRLKMVRGHGLLVRKRTRGHRVDCCHICRRLRDDLEGQDVMVVSALAKRLGIGYWALWWHLRELGRMGVDLPRLRLRSERIALLVERMREVGSLSLSEIRELGFSNPAQIKAYIGSLVRRLER